VHVYQVILYGFVQQFALTYSQARKCIMMDQFVDNKLYLAVDWIKVTKVAVGAGILKYFTQAINTYLSGLYLCISKQKHGVST
jgi:hypothetical protein